MKAPPKSSRAMGVGTILACMSWWPSWPSEPRPQVQSLPSSVTSAVCPAKRLEHAAITAFAPCSSFGGTFLGEITRSSLPWPRRPLAPNPHVQHPPSSVTATCLFCLIRADQRTCKSISRERHRARAHTQHMQSPSGGSRPRGLRHAHHLQRCGTKPHYRGMAPFAIKEAWDCTSLWSRISAACMERW